MCPNVGILYILSKSHSIVISKRSIYTLTGLFNLVSCIHNYTLSQQIGTVSLKNVRTFMKTLLHIVTEVWSGLDKAEYFNIF